MLTKNAIVWLGCAALSAVSGSAQMEEIGPALKSPESVVLSGPSVDLPVEFVNYLPVVQVMVNGRGPYRFGIETGAPFAAITPKVGEELGLSKIGDSKDPARTLVRVDEIKAGGIAFRNLVAVTSRFADERIDGVLGLPVYAEVLLTIDYPNSRVRFARGTLPPANGRDVLTAAHVGPFWGIPIEVGGRVFTAIVDTRSGGGFSFTPSFEDKLTFAAPPVVVGMARGAAIEPVEVRSGRLATDIKIGKYTFTTPTVALRPLPPQLPEGPLVGTSVLRNFAITLDQKAGTIQLARADAGEIVLETRAPAAPGGAPVRDLGFRVEHAADGALRVMQVLGSAPAAALGVRVGDQVISAGGTPAKEIDPGKWRALAAGAGTVHVVLQRDGQRLELDILTIAARMRRP